MNTQEILQRIGQFTNSDCGLFEQYTLKRTFKKKEVLLQKGEICASFHFILSGSFFQYDIKEMNEQIIDLHLPDEWMFNQESLTEQTPSRTTIQAFSQSEIITLHLSDFHVLCSKSSSFLQFGKILNQSKYRTTLFDESLSPAEKYDFITRVKPDLIKTFPLKMIASYLKITAETISRVRANF